jgi:hypothetical protein
MVRLDQATGVPPAIRVVVNLFDDVRRLTAR